MNEHQYERQKKKVEEELDRGIKLLQAAHKEKLKALALLRMMSGDPVEPESSRTVSLRRGELVKAFEAIFDALDRTFDKGAVLAAIHLTRPELRERAGERQVSAMLSREVEREGAKFKIETPGIGRAATMYAKL